jgi:tRNA pseudouridine55 synthase
MAAYVPETNDLVAIVERAKRGETKPVAVFN